MKKIQLLLLSLFIFNVELEASKNSMINERKKYWNNLPVSRKLQEEGIKISKKGIDIIETAVKGMSKNDASNRMSELESKSNLTDLERYELDFLQAK